MCRIRQSRAVLSNPKAGPQQDFEPTVYVAIANRVRDSEGSPAPSSLANFYDGQAECHFELSEGATVQKLVLDLINSLPMQLLFGLLGQGYKIVLGGHQLGGTVAHAMAARLLLQLRQEVKLAEQMGVNLSALSMTVDKVISFAFGSPLFANGSLQEALSSHGLHHNLHTIWKAGDGSPAFFTTCSDLASSGAPTSDSKPCLLPHIHTSGFKSAQAWAGALQAELAKLPRSAEQHMRSSAQPVADGDIAKVNQQRQQEGQPDQPRPPSLEILRGLGSSSRKEGSVLDSSLALPSLSGGPLAALPQRTQAAVAGNLAGAISRCYSTGKSAGQVAATSASLTTKPLPPKIVATLQEGSTSLKANAAARRATVTAGAPIASSTSWKIALLKLLGQAALLTSGSGSSSNLQPVGQFWILQSAADMAPPVKANEFVMGKSAAVAETIELFSLDPLHVSTTSLAWLSEANKDLFNRWEFGLAELQRDLIEAYQWTTFRDTAEMDGQVVDRRDMMKSAGFELG